MGFAKLPKATLDFLLKPENKAKLVDILTYHVAAGSVHAADLKNGEKIKTVEGKQVEARIFGSGKKSYVFINNARATTADVDASNGVVHIIDSVLIPPAMQAEIEASQNIVELASATPDLSTLVTALKAGGLVDTLSGTGPFTVFAPTDQAFARLPPGVLKHLLEPENKAKLDAVLEYHVVSGKITSNALKPEQDVKTLEGSDIEIAVIHAQGHTEVEINKHARVLKADVLASNGVMHVIDNVLIPKKMLLEIMESA